jgi:hypothetical protein
MNYVYYLVGSVLAQRPIKSASVVYVAPARIYALNAD